MENILVSFNEWNFQAKTCTPGQQVAAASTRATFHTPEERVQAMLFQRAAQVSSASWLILRFLLLSHSFFSPRLVEERAKQTDTQLESFLPLPVDLVSTPRDSPPQIPPCQVTPRLVNKGSRRPPPCRGVALQGNAETAPLDAASDAPFPPTTPRFHIRSGF